MPAAAAAACTRILRGFCISYQHATYQPQQQITCEHAHLWGSLLPQWALFCSRSATVPAAQSSGIGCCVALPSCPLCHPTLILLLLLRSPVFAGCHCDRWRLWHRALSGSADGQGGRQGSGHRAPAQGAAGEPFRPSFFLHVFLPWAVGAERRLLVRKGGNELLVLLLQSWAGTAGCWVKEAMKRGRGGCRSYRSCRHAFPYGCSVGDA